MTSSLVGSEMCIRDRLEPGLHVGQEHHETACHANPPAENPQAAAGSFCPVSYTHLTLPTICSV
eukprot:8088365-Prorocentrum_lima.AAC.1